VSIGGQEVQSITSQSATQVVVVAPAFAASGAATVLIRSTFFGNTTGGYTVNQRTFFFLSVLIVFLRTFFVGAKRDRRLT
jgi:hypothetical protein